MRISLENIQKNLSSHMYKPSLIRLNWWGIYLHMMWDFQMHTRSIRHFSRYINLWDSLIKSLKQMTLTENKNSLNNFLIKTRSLLRISRGRRRDGFITMIWEMIPNIKRKLLTAISSRSSKRTCQVKGHLRNLWLIHK
jgi:hypothetical protein